MKKLFFFLSLVTILSCSSSDDNSNINASNLHPPAWILGTWGWKDTDGTILMKEFKFTSNNIYHLFPGSEMELFPQIQGVKMKIDEEITDNKYYITCTYEGSPSKITYFFDKISSVKIKLQNTTTPSISPQYDKIE